MIAVPDAAIATAGLRAAVARRSPVVAAALDEEQAWVRARAWAASAVPDAVVDSVRVRSVLYRPDGRCTLRYVVGLAPSERERVLLVEVPRSATDVVIRPFPADPGLPTLPRALDRDLMRRVLGRVVPGVGGERAIGRCAVEVVHHPREGRCVLRYRLSVGAGGAGELRHPVVFGKVYGDDRAPAAAAALRLLRQGLGDDAGVVVPRPLGIVPPLRLGLAEPIAGRPVLPELIKAASAPDLTERLSSAVALAARTLAAVHACSAAGAVLPFRDLAGEVTTAERDIALLAPVWPEVAARLRPAVERAFALTGGHPPAPVLAHGDFTPGQVLLDGSGRAGIVDVDTLCVAEGALDVGRFLAYLQVTAVRGSRSAQSRADDLTALFLAAYLDARPAGENRRSFLERVAAFHGLALARLGASACRQLKDDRLAAALEVLDAGSAWTRSGAQ
jgi:hypothetical protein